jgi:large subunit ribosomal protein L22
MEFRAEQKYIRMSPKKIRPILREIKKLSVNEALSILPFVAKRGASLIEKVIKSAVSNAVQKGANIDDLKIKEIIANEGPVLKRGIPVSRGQWHPIKKRMTHLKVILSAAEREDKKKEEKKQAEPKLDDKDKKTTVEKKVVQNKKGGTKKVSKKVKK